jgi:hypothetical protein
MRSTPKLKKSQLGMLRLMPSVGLSGKSRIVVSIGSTDDFNLFTAAGSPTGPVTVVCTISAGAEIGSTSTSTAGFIFGSGWHVGTKIQVINNGTLMGKGGKGATGEGASVCTPVAGVNATAGGPAVDASGLPSAGMVDFTNNGTIAGGGGGGGYGGGGCQPPSSVSWGGGGGGSGRGKTTTTGGPGGPASGSSQNFPGAAGTSGTSAAAGGGGLGGLHPTSVDTGGAGADFAATGGTGLAAGAGYNAGAAGGAATVGDANINFLVLGTIIGART